MSILAALDGSHAEAERKKKLEQLAEAKSKIALYFGFTEAELEDALREAHRKKQLRGVEHDAARAQENRIRK